MDMFAFMSNCTSGEKAKCFNMIVVSEGKLLILCVLIHIGIFATSSQCGSVAEWSECSHIMRDILGSSSGRAMCFFLP